jgi:hypothetical protein
LPAGINRVGRGAARWWELSVCLHTSLAPRALIGWRADPRVVGRTTVCKGGFSPLHDGSNKFNYPVCSEWLLCFLLLRELSCEFHALQRFYLLLQFLFFFKLKASSVLLCFQGLFADLSPFFSSNNHQWLTPCKTGKNVEDFSRHTRYHRHLLWGVSWSTRLPHTLPLGALWASGTHYRLHTAGSVNPSRS